jgi:hypothetical protein
MNQHGISHVATKSTSNAPQTEYARDPPAVLSACKNSIKGMKLNYVGNELKFKINAKI